MIHLTRTDPARNMARFYALHLTPTLFGEWSLVREWGRIGQGGTVRQELFQGRAAAEQAFAQILERKQRRGYVTAASGDQPLASRQTDLHPRLHQRDRAAPCEDAARVDREARHDQYVLPSPTNGSTSGAPQRAHIARGPGSVGRGASTTMSSS